MGVSLRGVFTLLSGGVLLGVALLSSAAQANQPPADKTFYTIITPDGPMQVEMPVPSRRAQANAPVETRPSTPVPRPPANTVVQPVSPVQPVAPLAAAPTSTTPISTKAAQPASPVTSASAVVPAKPVEPARSVAPSPFEEFGGQQYVDTAYLEQREFNLDGKKRFYSLPDGLGGTQVIERESGVRLSSVVPQFESTPAVSLAASYRRVAPNALVELTNQQCLAAKQLKEAKLLNDKPVDFWPVPSFQPKFEFVLAELAPDLRNIHVMSYTSTSRRPSYYWPLPIFLDQRGCILEGVAGFYQSKIPATWLQQAALQGHLAVPKDARYVLLTPLVEAAELSGETLADRGQLRLTPLRLAAP